jgi:hypothetical protein
MKRLLLALTFCSTTAFAQNKLQTPFEASNGKESATWQQAIDFYEELARTSQTIDIATVGETDGANPLHLVYFTADSFFNREQWKKENKIIILINNGIHAGEPDGVDASMLLLRDAATGKIKIPGNVVLAVIPVYNVGGFLNRGSYSRANQNGPLEYGFRGNGQNLDLNRDFIKCDAAETRTLERIFTQLQPDIFIDNHVSDGADYQHVMTLLATQHDKLGGETGEFMYKTFTPAIYAAMKKKGYDLVPYVNDFDNTPVNGWREFFEPPRFASGYAALYHTIAYVPETHMLKPFKDRVWATYELMKCMIYQASEKAETIKRVRNNDFISSVNQQEFAIDWKIDTTRFDTITFKGYEAAYKQSEVSGLPRLFYDRSKPFTKQVPFYNHYLPAKTVKAPKAYIIPAGWPDVIHRMKDNGVQMKKLQHDTTITVTAYVVDNYETVPKPYEKHYLHKNIKTRSITAAIRFHAGDYIVSTTQDSRRYLIETLEPTAPDGFFAWNYFDAILQQKEYFSDYVFEDIAADLLKKDPELKKQLEEKKKADAEFAKSAQAQLDFVYRHSPYMEPGYMRYPVYRIE